MSFEPTTCGGPGTGAPALLSSVSEPSPATARFLRTCALNVGCCRALITPVPAHCSWPVLFCTTNFECQKKVSDANYQIQFVTALLYGNKTTFKTSTVSNIIGLQEYIHTSRLIERMSFFFKKKGSVFPSLLFQREWAE